MYVYMYVIFIRNVGVNRIPYWSQGDVASLPHKCQPPLSSARQHPSYVDCLEVKREYYQNSLLRAGLCDTMCTVSSTLMRAVLTGPADWVCHMGPLRHAYAVA